METMKSMKMGIFLLRVTALVCIFSLRSDANLNPPLRTHKRFIEVALSNSKVSKISIDILSSLSLIIPLGTIMLSMYCSYLLAKLKHFSEYPGKSSSI
ncbi:unnamed protein product [Schistosoma margrebowiei]|uniref:Uncharacterized protein n=1 Tax=Schistosoma margrebowiei TaxID=48269 RepID=A0A3P7WMI8_9TREM|nr:unnamed protein product [Schistosoma margrebowiei]